MNTIMKLTVITTFACGITACNTIEGAGQDVEYVGEAVQDGAQAVEDELND